jgi:hypothetical protein
MSNLQATQNHRAKSLHKLTTAYVNAAQGINKSLVELTAHFDVMNDAALKIRCSLSEGNPPSEEDVQHAVANEIARLLGVAGTSLFAAIDINALGSPDKAPQLVGTACRTAATLTAALQSTIAEENKAKQAEDREEARRQLSITHQPTKTEK